MSTILTNKIETKSGGLTLDPGAGGSVTVLGSLAGTITTAAQPNITSIGTLSSLTVAGALNGTISTAAQTNITSVGTLTGLTVSADASINSLTVGRGANNISTNTALGNGALFANTSGNQNTAVGYLALEDNTTGNDNTAVGRIALFSNTTGGQNTAIGRAALIDNTTGKDNTAVGRNALLSNTTASSNTAVGKDALGTNTTGANNVAVGKDAMLANTTGTQNVAVGWSALEVSTTGFDNTAVGILAGLEITTGSNNILLGKNSGRGGSPSGLITTGSNNVVLGDNNIANLYCADTTISSSDSRDKTDVEDFTYGLDWITQLRPVTYRWDKRSWYVGNDATTEDLLNAQPDGSKKRSKLHIGFLAQEELEVEKQFGFGETKDDMLIANINEDESAYGIKYERLVPVLVNAIKELKAEIELLKAK